MPPCRRRQRATLLRFLRKHSQKNSIGTVVATAGSTLLGAVDPIADIVELKKKYDFHLHIDAAYGGFFRISDNLYTEVKRHFEAISQADSLAIDPHKHGLQPYGCGCILFQKSESQTMVLSRLTLYLFCRR